MLARPVAGDAAPAPRPAAEHQTYVLHLPGISGALPDDKQLLAGLAEGGITAQTEIFDWTGGRTGIPALQNYKQNHEIALKLAQKIIEHYRADPLAPICLVGHSGGSGLAVWALENLPAEVQIDSLLLLAPALSPDYDLTKALRHVRCRAYVFSSLMDTIVLGTGTKMFGTIDGVKCDAAGRVGFNKPKSADEAEYTKLVSKPYDRDWMKLYGHIGDHMGPLGERFAREYLAPLLLKDLAVHPTSQPARSAAGPTSRQTKPTSQPAISSAGRNS